MPSRQKPNGPSSIRTSNPEPTRQSPPTQSFRDILIELSDAFAILSVDHPRQMSPSGTIDNSSGIKQFERSSKFDLIEEIGVPLPDILWVFALIFSPSRGGAHIVASVPREQPPELDDTKSLFTLYLTTNN
ncbi:hypothetical protein F4823DRAFT_563867 [Ustulina deusta]|nr:hypothetical protein F4823DRAFT_563867 [Ustulina deusta]